MNRQQLRTIVDWFHSYVETFFVDGAMPAPLRLKVEHSEWVAHNARQLAEDLEWSPEQTNCAEALGWLHDVGRFSQFAEFGTFSDAHSINHGERGWEIVRENRILRALAPDDQDTLLDGIRNHNVKIVPGSLGIRSLQFTKLIRDADKLDIYRVVLDSIHRDGFQELPSMLPQIDLQGPVNASVVHEIVEHRYCSLENVYSLSDFLLMLLSWIHDLNYEASFRQIVDRNIIGELEQLLPEDRPCKNVVHAIRRFTKSKLAAPA